MSTKQVIKVMSGKSGPSKRGGASGPRVKLVDGNKNKKPVDIVDEIVTEEHFILRMPPGDPAAKLREAVKARDIPENVSFSFVDNRRGTFQLGDQTFQTKLVDLPCIIESQKTLDSKQFYKIADICQMLIVEDKPPQPTQVQFKQQPNPDEFTWPDGLTPPLKNVRKRRFRKRLSKKAIEDVEREVERLLKADAKAQDVRTDWKDPEEWEREQEEKAQRQLEEAEAREREAEARERGEILDVENEDDAEADAEGDFEMEDAVQYGEEASEQGEGDEVGDLTMEIFDSDGDDEDGGADGSESQDQTNERETAEQDGSDDDDSEGESVDEEEAAAAEEERERKAEIERLQNEITESARKMEEKRAEAEKHINPLMKQRSRGIADHIAEEIAKNKKRLAELMHPGKAV